MKLKDIIHWARLARESYQSRSDQGALKRLRKSARRTLRIKGGAQTNQDHLLEGDHEAYGKKEYQEIAPWMFYELPADLRAGAVIDGRLPNGDAPGVIGLRHITSDDVVAMSSQSTKSGISIGLKTGLAVTALSLLASSSSFSFSIPQWTLEEWIWELPFSTQLAAISAEMAVWGIEFVTNLLATLINGASFVAISVILGVISGILAMSVATTSSLNNLWVRYRNALTSHLNLPTRQGLHHWKNELANRAEVLDAYSSAAYQSITRLKDLPFIRLGKSTGIMSDRGSRLAPLQNTVVGWDGESIRQHIICFGETGTGKTRLFLKPLFAQMQSADWGDHKMGAVIFDGKGELAFALRDTLPAHRREDFILIGTEDSAYGVDLLASMTPVEVADQFLLIASQLQGPSDGNSGKWLAGAANAVKHGAFLAGFIEASNPQEIASLWSGRNYKPYSLLGLLAVTTETNLYQKVSTAVLNSSRDGKAIAPDVVAAARFFSETWAGMAAETRSSYQSNITDTLDQLSGTKKLAEKFASGEINGVSFIDLDAAFDGKIIGVGLSGTEDSKPGLIIANWIKSRLYVLAQRRITQAAKADETLKRVEFCKRSYDELNTSDLQLTDLKRGLADRRKAAIEHFRSLFPDEDTVDLIEMSRSVERRHLQVKESLRPLREVRKLARGADDEKLAELKRLRDAPTKSSVMVVIDEYQSYVTVGEGGKADSSFLNVARASGVFVVAATQSLQAIYQAVGQTAGDNIMNCMVSKISFPTSDPATQDYFIKLAGDGPQGMSYARNFYSSFGRLLRDWGVGYRTIDSLAAPSSTPNFQKAVLDDVLSMRFEDVNVGSKSNTNVSEDKDGWVDEKHRRDVEKETAIKDELEKAIDTPYLSVTDLKAFDQGRAFCFVSRAGRTRMDFIHLGAFSESHSATAA